MNTQLTKSRIHDKIKGLASHREEGADIVQTILIIALFVVICIIVGTLMMNAIQGQAKNASDCIENANKRGANQCQDYRG